MSSQRSDRRERLNANLSRMEQELAFKLQEDRIVYRTQVEMRVTTADFHFLTQPRQLIVFVDGRVHLGKTQIIIPSHDSPTRTDYVLFTADHSQRYYERG